MTDRPDLKRLDQDLEDILLRVCALLRDAGGRAWLVGGSVRDAVAGLEIRDLDVEVFGLHQELHVLQGTVHVQVAGEPAFGRKVGNAT